MPTSTKGLGISFLKHIERTSTLVIVLDIAPDDEEHDPFRDYEILRKELSAYNSEMLNKPSFVVLNKVDKDGAAQNVKSFRERYPFDPSTLFEVSAKEEQGLKELLRALHQKING